MKNWMKKNKFLLLVICFTMITCVSVLITIHIMKHDKVKMLYPDYPNMETEKYAEKIPKSDEESDKKLEKPDGGGAASLTYSKMVNITGKDIILFFQNPSKSTQNIILEIIVQDNVIAKSGIVMPGYGVEHLDLLQKYDLEKGEYEGKFNILYYDEESGEKAIINTEIPINITVN